MKRRQLVLTAAAVLSASIMIGGMQANASYFDVINAISNTAYTINSVNSAARGTMSTVEYSQRFQDRQQDRKDRKRSEKEYNENAEQEYYRTLQETQALRQKYYYDQSPETQPKNVDVRL